MAGVAYRSFRDFYPFYLTEHRRSGTRRLHFTGTLLVLLTLAYAVLTRRWGFLALVPLFGYGLAWVVRRGEEPAGDIPAPALPSRGRLSHVRRHGPGPRAILRNGWCRRGDSLGPSLGSSRPSANSPAFVRTSVALASDME